MELIKNPTPQEYEAYLNLERMLSALETVIEEGVIKIDGKELYRGLSERQGSGNRSL